MSIRMMPGELPHSAQHNSYELAVAVPLLPLLLLQGQLLLWLRMVRQLRRASRSERFWHWRKSLGLLRLSLGLLSS